MEYHLHIEPHDGGAASVLPYTASSIVDAYDHCVELLKKRREARAVHLFLGQNRLHTVHR